MAFCRYRVAAGRSKAAIFTRPMLKSAVGESGDWVKAREASVWAASLRFWTRAIWASRGRATCGAGVGRVTAASSRDLASSTLPARRAK